MLGFRMESDGKRLPQEITDQFRTIGTTIIADAMGRFHTMNGIRHYNNPGARLIGTALTVRTIIGDNLMIHKAIDMAQPGHVIVVEGGGDVTRALLGEIMCRIGQKRQIAGFVVDGAIRDAEAIRQMGFPVFAKGVNPAGPYKEGPGQINVGISCAGTAVHPGDLIVGDDDGVVVVPYENAAEVLLQARKICDYEEEMLRQIEAGTLDRSWVDQTLQEKGFKLKP
jgi:RraA family protein